MKHMGMRLGIVGMIALGAFAKAPAEREHTNPTGWWWLQGVNEATIDDKVEQDFRLINLEIESAPPHVFSAVFVKNTGVHAKTWSWRYGYTENQLETFMSQNNRRIIDLEVARIDGQPRLTAVMIRNSGNDATAWWYYYDKSFDFIDDKVTEHNGRIIDLDTYIVNGTRYWSAVMVRNTGNQFRNWWWYSNLTWAQVQTKMDLHDARIIDLERRGDGNYAVVLQALGSEYWWYKLGSAEDSLNHFVDQRGGRIFDLETYYVGNQKRFSAIMLNNSNPLETRIGKMIRDNTDGVYGFYLKLVDSSVLANIFENKPFYPASAIKALEHVYAMRQVQIGLSINAPVELWPNHTDDNHGGDPPPPTAPLGTVLTNMMVPSSNSAANNIQDYFGDANGIVGRWFMNIYAQNTIGTSPDFRLNHKFATGGPDGNDPANSATLVDFAKLYQGIANGSLLDEANRDVFYSLMLARPDGTNSGFFNDLEDIVDEEAADLGVSNADREFFKDEMEGAHKDGSLTVSLGYKAYAGMVRLPIRGARVRQGWREYVYGVFVHGYTFFDQPKPVAPELLREAIRSALITYL